jgi:hypothetical protein
MLLLTAAPAAADEIYKWTDAQGNVHFGNRKPGGAVRNVETTQGGTLNQDESAPPVRGKGPSSPEEQARFERLHHLQRENRKSEQRPFKPLVVQDGRVQQEPRKRSESECQSTYGKSCSDLDNWREQAVEKCKQKGSVHCDDDSYIDKQKPKTLREQEDRAEERRDNRKARYNRAQRDLR